MAGGGVVGAGVSGVDINQHRIVASSRVVGQAHPRPAFTDSSHEVKSVAARHRHRHTTLSKKSL